MTKQVARIARILGPDAGETSGLDNGLNRFMIDGARTDGRVSVVEHRIPPRTLAAPLHLHTREDEYSYVLEGRVGAIFGDEEIFAEQGDFVFKPRSEWHTFWNAGDSELRILEIITPAGLENMFKRFGSTIETYGPDALPALAAEFGCELDFPRTMAIAERYNVTF